MNANLIEPTTDFYNLFLLACKNKDSGLARQSLELASVGEREDIFASAIVACCKNPPINDQKRFYIDFDFFESLYPDLQCNGYQILDDISLGSVLIHNDDQTQKMIHLISKHKTDLQQIPKQNKKTLAHVFFEHILPFDQKSIGLLQFLGPQELVTLDEKGHLPLLRLKENLLHYYIFGEPNFTDSHKNFFFQFIKEFFNKTFKCGLEENQHCFDIFTTIIKDIGLANPDFSKELQNELHILKAEWLKTTISDEIQKTPQRMSKKKI